MKITINAAIPEYPRVTAQQLKDGQCVRYAAGNGVVKLNCCGYLLFDTDGKIYSFAYHAESLGHGYGDLLPKGTTLTIAL